MIKQNTAKKVRLQFFPGLRILAPSVRQREGTRMMQADRGRGGGGGGVWKKQGQQRNLRTHAK